MAHSHYSGLDYAVTYWRTASQLEVDFVLGDGEVAVEVKASGSVVDHHLRGIRAFRDEHRPRLTVVVSMDARPRLAHGITVLPWADFLGRLWRGELLA